MKPPSAFLLSYFINISTPVIWNSLYVQTGAPITHIIDNNGKEQPCFITFKRDANDSYWKYVGACTEKGLENCFIEESVYEKFIKLIE